jgi:hypothetical protein
MTVARVSPTAHESDLMRAYIEAIPFAIPRMRVFRRNILQAKLEGGFHVKAGIPGQCDAYAYLAGRQQCYARHGPCEWRYVDRGCEHCGQMRRDPSLMGSAIPIEIEFKSARARWTDKQKAWRAFCEEWRIPYLALEARKDETPGQTVNRWVDETRELVGRLT